MVLEPGVFSIKGAKVTTMNRLLGYTEFTPGIGIILINSRTEITRENKDIFCIWWVTIRVQRSTVCLQ